MYKPSPTYTLAQVDNNRSEYIDTSSTLAAKRSAYAAVSDSGKGTAAARRYLAGIERKVPGASTALSARLTIVVPTGSTEAVTDGEIDALILELLSSLTGYTVASEAMDTARILADVKQSLKGIITLADTVSV